MEWARTAAPLCSIRLEKMGRLQLMQYLHPLNEILSVVLSGIGISGGESGLGRT